MAHKKLQEREPWRNGDDDKYVARLFKKSLSLIYRKKACPLAWFESLPPNLKNRFYASKILR